MIIVSALLRLESPKGDGCCCCFSDFTGRCSDVHVLRPAKISMPRRIIQYWTGVCPPVNDWTMLWLAWDIVTKSMVPRDALMSRPIDLRNPLIFYLGHIPTFTGKQNAFAICGSMLIVVNRYSFDPRSKDCSHRAEGVPPNLRTWY